MDLAIASATTIACTRSGRTCWSSPVTSKRRPKSSARPPPAPATSVNATTWQPGRPVSPPHVAGRHGLDRAARHMDFVARPLLRLLALQASALSPEEVDVAELLLGQVVVTVDHLVVELGGRALRRAEDIGALVAILEATGVEPAGGGVRVCD